jgi:predicted  nucleic acid-binding Zn-ribbon protein
VIFDASTISIIAGGLATPIGALLIYLFSRRAQLRQLNTTSDAAIVNSATTFVTQLQAQITMLNNKVAQLEAERTSDRARYVEELNRAHDENSRMSAIVAQLKTDTDIAERQINELRRRLPGTL